MSEDAQRKKREKGGKGEGVKFWQQVYADIPLPCINECLCNVCQTVLVIKDGRHYCNYCHNYRPGRLDCREGG